MSQSIRNFEYAQVLPFAEQVSYQRGQVVSKTLAQNESLSLTLFAFDKEEEISTHTSKGDALVIVLDGSCEVTVSGVKYTLRARGIHRHAVRTASCRLGLGTVQDVPRGGLSQSLEVLARPRH